MSIPCRQNLAKFYLDLPSMVYINFPYVTCLILDSKGGWNPNLEESYLLKYREYEGENSTKCTEIFHLHPIQVSIPNPSPISSYSKSPNMTIFCLIGFSSMKP